MEQKVAICIIPFWWAHISTSEIYKPEDMLILLIEMKCLAEKQFNTQQYEKFVQPESEIMSF